MNLNHQIKPVQPTLNVWRKLNEVIDTLNWIMSMYGEVSSDGNSQLQIIPGSRGPVFKMNVQGGNQEPWATDPNGYPGHWQTIIFHYVGANSQYQLQEAYAWLGEVTSPYDAGWAWETDPDGVQAQWVQHDVCVAGTVVQKWFWGSP